MGESFQILRPSSMRDSSRRVCSSALTSSQYLMKMMPESTIAFSTAGTAFRNCFTSSLEQNPITRSTPARLYQLRSKITISPAAGQVRQVALHVHLALFPLGRRRQRDDAKDARTHALGDGLDGAALAGTSRPSKMTQTLRPLCTIHCCAFTSSTCRRLSSFS